MSFSVDELIHLANSFGREYNLNDVSSFSEINDHFFVNLFIAMFDDVTLNNKLMPYSKNTFDRLSNLRSIISYLEDNIVKINLSHLHPENIIEGQRTSVCHLLQIVNGIHKIICSQLDSNTHLTEYSKLNSNTHLTEYSQLNTSSKLITDNPRVGLSTPLERDIVATQSYNVLHSRAGGDCLFSRPVETVDDGADSDFSPVKFITPQFEALKNQIERVEKEADKILELAHTFTNKKLEKRELLHDHLANYMKKHGVFKLQQASTKSGKFDDEDNTSLPWVDHS